MLSTGERSRNQPVRVAKQLLDAARFWFLHSLDSKRAVTPPLGLTDIKPAPTP